MLGLFVCLGLLMWTVGSLTTVEQYSLRGDGLSLFSVSFNPSAASSSWVDRVFGYSSVHHMSSAGVDLIRSVQPISSEEIRRTGEKFQQMIWKDFDDNPALLWPKCSFELLGTVLLDEFEPFVRVIRHKDNIVQLPIGKAKLFTSGVFNSTEQLTDCYYRALYENWKPEIDALSPNHWSTVFYCPVLSQKLCNSLLHTAKLKQSIQLTVSIAMNKSITWTDTIHTDLSIQYKVKSIKSHISFDRGNFHAGDERMLIHSRHPRIGVCLPIPYSSTDAGKNAANKVLLSEWMKYYSFLNISIFIYDNAGHNEAIVKHTARKFGLENVHYHNFTVRGALVPEFGDLYYDNNERTKSMDQDHSDTKSFLSGRLSDQNRYFIQGIDKTLTLTLCRFEAKAMHGIDNVIVADFDEFLYCPRAESYVDKYVQQGLILKNSDHVSGAVQSIFFHNLVDSLRARGFHQLTMSQRILANKTISNRDCFVNQAKLGKSIFDCISAYDYYIDRHSVKSIHLGHHCPLTGYHLACPSSDQPRSFDCLCLNQNIEEEDCGFIHFSSNNLLSNRPLVYSTDSEDPVDNIHLQKMRESTNEIKYIIENMEV